MSGLVVHFASGASFFSGSACLIAGMVIVILARHKILPAIGRLGILAGLLLIGLSATPLPLWAWSAWGGLLVTWVILRLIGKRAGTLPVPPTGEPGQVPSHSGAPFEHDRRSEPMRRRSDDIRSIAAAVAVGAFTLAAVGWELSWQVPLPSKHKARGQAGKPELRGNLVVIGDSLSAEDFTEGGDPWPTLLAHEHGVEVRNLAFSGAKAGSAAKRLPLDELNAADLVLLEIGGNDLLGATTSADFEQNLDLLLAKVCARPVLVAMLELPLLPLYNRYGEIQRRLARRYDVILIPKRCFASVLMGEQATLDGLHLSPAGHRKMAAMVWEQLAPFLTTQSARDDPGEEAKETREITRGLTPPARQSS